jgi:predicted site-specific integrase-resolvase
MTATTDPGPPPDGELWTRAELAALLGVYPETVSRWDRAGKFPEGAVFRTPGGHRRFRGEYIRSLLAGAR